jgi:hypothetical protein
MLANNLLCNMGRLGNQMFQYAALRGLAAKHGYDYCLPPQECLGKLDHNCANSDCTIFDCFELPDASRLLLNVQTIEESCFELDDFLWNSCPDNITLQGYFQTEKYFKHIESDIRSAFTFKESIRDLTTQCIRENFNNTELISIHIRRGDYLNFTHHPVLDMNYYQNALEQLPQLPVLIFSDDVGWCKQQKLFSGDRFHISDNNSTAYDLCLQSYCSYHVIANSSFSWWGAWLAKSKKVIAPRNWFGPPLKHNTNDLYCEGWLKC